MRAPHIATRAVVQSAGTPAARELYSTFARFNRQHFGRRLGPPLILITHPRTPRTEGDYCPQDEHGLESRIRIAPRVVERGDERYLHDVLLHECVHAWMHEVEHDTEPGYRGHGPGYAAKCNAIGEKLGLPPVGVKGRNGLPDCAYWPLNVRPADYYAQPWEPPTRRAKPKDEAVGDRVARGEGEGDEGEGIDDGDADPTAETPRASMEAARGAAAVLRAVANFAEPTEALPLARWRATLDHLRALSRYADSATFGPLSRSRARVRAVK